MELIFLGTGGGRYVTGEQRRRTGGIVVKTEETQVHVDPGPGALVRLQEELDKPLNTEAVIVSHSHLDHSNDTEAIVEMITECGKHPGVLLGSESVLEGYGEMEKSVDEYHKDLVSRVEVLEDDTTIEFKDLKVRSQEMFHTDPKTVGFTVETEEKRIGFWTDSEASEELFDFYEGCGTLVVYCAGPEGESFRGHTSVSDVPDLVSEAGVENVILTHFGYKMLETGPEEQKQWLEERVEANVILAEDGMKYPGNRSLNSF